MLSCSAASPTRPSPDDSVRNRAWNDPYLLVRAATTAWHGDPAAEGLSRPRRRAHRLGPSFAVEAEVWHLKALAARPGDARLLTLRD